MKYNKYPIIMLKHYLINPKPLMLQKPLINVLALISHKIVKLLFSIFIRCIRHEEDYQNYRMPK